MSPAVDENASAIPCRDRMAQNCTSEDRNVYQIPFKSHVSRRRDTGHIVMSTGASEQVFLELVEDRLRDSEAIFQER